ncbi:pyrroloquinoline quinone biosynthesis peptide chaperone PqqD [Sedimenticola sp.]|uniref:pyrroloquinoline quinone biosynthesis peptide chaperone PqqD n=1 Tax=Sedimenticola sp. TaxID=1940285 RepID=UPI00258A8FF1|nr:pyrroloquinoline quinone biosynthesis peptide chaperone PqqD [Sedimenticola sp.]MCW8905191.1 pyrroloquinoline quinone biosynthesis peptide chaperone PqqD [Sedimenticola sp.]
MILSNTPFSPSDRPVINPVFLFRWEEQEQAYLLLYPEGIIKLNDSAGNILKLCDGELTLQSITEKLKILFGDEGIDDDIYNFMEVARGKGWIKAKD